MRLFVTWISVVIGLGNALAHAELPQGAPRSSAGAATDTLWILASEEAPWSVALAAPVAAHLGRSGQSPLVMAIGSPPTREAQWLLSLTAGPRPIVLATSRSMKLGSGLEERSPEMLHIGDDPSQASAIVARRFWNHSGEAVVAAADDPEAIILGSSLAAGMGVPLLLYPREEEGTAVSAAIRDLSVGRMLVAVSERKKTPHWIEQETVAHEILPPDALEDRLISALGPGRIRNVVVARAPDERGDVGGTAWLAPYLSSAHGSPVILVHAQGPAIAEADVRELMRRRRLLPQTVTILADYASIGYRNTDIDPTWLEDERVDPPEMTAQPASSCGTASSQAGAAAPQIYKVRTEPFVPTQADELATLGVGRIPLGSLGDASVFFARGLVRARLMAHRPPRLLMVSNSGAHRVLPLCETVSRTTAAEFKNFGVHVDEFYGRNTDSPEILDAARSANLILYEGHSGYQSLIVPPILRPSRPEDFAIDDEDLKELAGPRPAADGASSLLRGPPVVAAEPMFARMQGPLNGLPIIVLQACQSLDENVLWRVDELGGAALIGSMTPIHSGCGSSLLNAAMNSILYRGGTVGEALRDAENYMFCAEELKARRGHKEQAKGVRVALSFRLWGDPELAVLPNLPEGPRQAPLRAEWVGNDTLRIDVPQSRLPDAYCDRYVASMFPNSQTAGLIKFEGEMMKRVLPLYYFCLPLPEGLAQNAATDLEPSRHDARHLDVRIDRTRRLLYLVYYPEQESPGESFVLHLKAVPAAEQTGRLAK